MPRAKGRIVDPLSPDNGLKRSFLRVTCAAGPSRGRGSRGEIDLLASDGILLGRVSGLSRHTERGCSFQEDNPGSSPSPVGCLVQFAAPK